MRGTELTACGDVDQLNAPMDVTAGSKRGDVDRVLSKARSSLSGQRQLTDGRPGPDYFVIAFSTDPRAWQLLSRRTYATRPADDGVFTIEEMLPVDYFITVMSDFDLTMLSSPEFFEQAGAAGLRVSLAEGEHREQTFQIKQ